MAVRRDHKGGAQTAVLQTTMGTNSPATILLDTATGWPDGTPGPFFIVVDRDTPLEEKILVTSRSGTTLTIGQRGADDTTAQSHSIGANVEHCLSALELDEANAHIMATTGVHGIGGGDTVVGSSTLTSTVSSSVSAHAALTTGVHGLDALDSRLDTLEGQTLDARLDVLEAQTLDARLDVLEGQTLDTRIDTLELLRPRVTTHQYSGTFTRQIVNGAGNILSENVTLAAYTEIGGGAGKWLAQVQVTRGTYTSGLGWRIEVTIGGSLVFSLQPDLVQNEPNASSLYSFPSQGAFLAPISSGSVAVVIRADDYNPQETLSIADLGVEVLWTPVKVG